MAWLTWPPLSLILKKRKKKKRREKKKKKEEKHQPRMGMAGVVVDGMADMATVIVVGVIMAHIVSELFSILKN